MPKFREVLDDWLVASKCGKRVVFLFCYSGILLKKTLNAMLIAFASAGFVAIAAIFAPSDKGETIRGMLKDFYEFLLKWGALSTTTDG